MRLIVSFLMVMVTVEIFAQDIRLIDANDIHGLQILSSRDLQGREMFDFLGQNAVIYTEYGTQRLLVNEYALDKDKVTVYVCSMPTGASAFGLYSVWGYQCIRQNLFGSVSCSTPYHISAISGTIYITAENRAGTQSGMILCEQIIKLLIDRNPKDIWYAPALVQSAKAAPYTGSLRYFMGPVGLAKTLPLWAGMFEKISFHMFTMNIVTTEYAGVISRISFPDERNLNDFLNQSGAYASVNPDEPTRTSDNLYRSWYRINNTKILFLECNSDKLNIKEFVPQTPDPYWLVQE